LSHSTKTSAKVYTWAVDAMVRRRGSSEGTNLKIGGCGTGDWGLGRPWMALSLTRKVGWKFNSNAVCREKSREDASSHLQYPSVACLVGWSTEYTLGSFQCGFCSTSFRQRTALSHDDPICLAPASSPPGVDGCACRSSRPYCHPGQPSAADHSSSDSIFRPHSVCHAQPFAVLHIWFPSLPAPKSVGFLRGQEVAAEGQ
jgi:hypothetical protein